MTIVLLLNQIPGTRIEPPFDVDFTKTANVYARTRSYGFGPEVQRRILLGTYALSAEYVYPCSSRKADNGQLNVYP